ncbi:hypothetical protein GCM10027093_05610 [Paraburkholderia jirisanensis]
MQGKLLEHKQIDLDAAPGHACAVTHLTDEAEPRWAGIVDLGPSQRYTLDTGMRYNVYVLRGAVEIDGLALNADDFVIQCGHATIRAGQHGARVLVHREASVAVCEPTLQPASERSWHTGRNPQMRVALLSDSGYRVSLVEWQPGAHTVDHGHSKGEEIFVLSGELRDADQHYPAGSWLRLHPGARHEPFVAKPTVILLRNGHLPQ